jgi:hypothetical protein
MQSRRGQRKDIKCLTRRLSETEIEIDTSIFDQGMDVPTALGKEMTIAGQYFALHVISRWTVVCATIETLIFS